jgi:hypothetical protein
MTRSVTSAFVAVLLFPTVVLAQAAAPAKPPLATRIWIAAGAGFSAERTGCPSCPEDGVYADSYNFIVDAGLSVNHRMDVGMELMWVDLNVDGASHVKTVFVLGVAQFRPWAEHGFYLRAAMGLGIAGNGLYNPYAPPLPPPYTTNALAIAYGAGWELKLNPRWGLQAYGTHHVAGLGELTKTDNTTLKNVVVNYWTVGGGIVFRR